MLSYKLQEYMNLLRIKRKSLRIYYHMPLRITKNKKIIKILKDSMK